MFSENQLLPLSGLQHLLYCPRQCALIHLEQLWTDNQYTTEGDIFHARAHEAPDESRLGVRSTHSLPVRSLKLGLSGQCDVVEFHPNGQIIPIEYKRGKAKEHHADEVQLCAQALCIEEMLNTSITHGFLFYGKTRRRVIVEFSTSLRELSCKSTAEFHQLIESSITPLAEYLPKLCDACSLIELCQPRSLRLQRGAKYWFEQQIQINLHQDEP